MKPMEPPGLALALLRLITRDDDALAGDLVEEFHAGRSRRWFWRQVMRAAVYAPWRRRGAPAEPGLVLTGPHFDRVPGLALLDPATINLSGIKVRGVGGLGLLAIVGLVTVVLPEAWWLVLTGIAGGVVAGILLVVRRRARGLSDPGGRRPLRLFEDNASPGPPDQPPALHGRDLERLVAAGH